MQEMNYLQPDIIWRSFGVTSDTDFIDKFVLKGIFHSLVPVIIVEDYKLVERLLFYNYFNYPLLDEAFSKSTRIFEASVTLKLEIVGLKKKKDLKVCILNLIVSKNIALKICINNG